MRINAHLIPTLRFRADAAKKLGLSEAHISKLIRRYTNLDPKVRQRLAGTKLARTGNELDALAALPPDRQRKVVDLLLDWPDLYRTVADADRKVTGRPAQSINVDDAEYQRLMAAWIKGGHSARKKFVKHLAGSHSDMLTEALKSEHVA